MSNKPFQFKQFSIHQHKTAMKVGTDGVLLGAWVKILPGTNSVLDIGTGTGLIALMIAQRCSLANIDAVEFNAEAFEQAVDNFENSNWGDRLFCYHASIQEFCEEFDEKYDLIVANPPFFNPTNYQIPKNRVMARHTQTLSYPELLKCTTQLLSEKGTCAFIVPFSEEKNVINLALKFKLNVFRKTHVRGNKNSPVKRSLLQFSFSEAKLDENEIIVENSRHNYTTEYTDLVRNFYLNL
jgi:tRNA1Val (adenine37-N6)-methyltransferase